MTVVPVLDAFKAAHPHVTVSVVCDAGMLSATSLIVLEEAGYGFIVGSRIAKTPYDIAEYQHDGDELQDGQTCDSTQRFGRGDIRRERRMVYQPDRAGRSWVWVHRRLPYREDSLRYC
ncbi:hypothetical protein [Lysinibacter sp. HNR]|uniref:hypothetical protein n=1 Tax=Lysinibacter sp. HNR TaxID=3031408 RepID=UPI00243488FE|nr:hypothetical protein [Lysinibacter sp. HNR]WGD36865.1 hypothetical protein FrondiHNR_10475 [Lysinibacter sp. HNR]